MSPVVHTCCQPATVIPMVSLATSRLDPRHAVCATNADRCGEGHFGRSADRECENCRSSSSLTSRFFHALCTSLACLHLTASRLPVTERN